MTAVQGIELLPPRESETRPVGKESKGDTPFEMILTESRDKSQVSQNEEPRSEEMGAKELIARIKPEGGEKPVLSGKVNTGKISRILQELEEDLEMEQPVQNTKILAFSRDSGIEQSKELISRFLNGEISRDELAVLSSLESEAIQAGTVGVGEKIGLNSEMLMLVSDGKDERAAKMTAGLEKGTGGEVLRGVLTEEGELFYFDKKTAGKSVGRTDKMPASFKVSGENRKTAVMEINVTDLRQAGELETAGLKDAAVLSEEVENLVMNRTDAHEMADAEGGDDLLNTPAEKLISAEGSGGKLQAPVTKEVSRMFQNYMKDTGSKELVRKIDFVLKDAGTGEIKLILKPEALGNVRINLSLNENNIAGKIFVDNNSVRDVFLNNMDQLTNLLKENGYEDAALEVWVGQQGEDRNPEQDRPEKEQNIRTVQGAGSWEESVPQTVESGYYGSGSGQVNLII